jgi:hypothetical protein
LRALDTAAGLEMNEGFPSYPAGGRIPAANTSPTIQDRRTDIVAPERRGYRPDAPVMASKICCGISDVELIDRKFWSDEDSGMGFGRYYMTCTRIALRSNQPVLWKRRRI